MNEVIAKYVEKRKQELEKEEMLRLEKKRKKQIEKLKELGVASRIIYAEPGTQFSDEWLYYDEVKKRRYKTIDVEIGDFTDEEFEEALKYSENGKCEFLKGLNLKKMLTALYIIWVGLHFVFLFFGSAGNWNPSRESFLDINEYVWPFKDRYGDSNNIVSYDISEFLVYTMLPILIYHVVKLFKQSIKH